MLSEAEQLKVAAQFRARVADISVPGLYPGSTASDADYIRFLVARDFNIDKAESMLRAHAEWRAKLPTEQDAHTQMLLQDKRCGELIGFTPGNELVFLSDSRWGKMMHGTTTEQYTKALIFFMDNMLSEMEKRGSRKWCVVSIGGPPPLDQGLSMTRLLEANFPGVMNKIIIAPIPAKVKSLVQSVLRILPERTRNKCALASTGAEVCETLRLRLEDFPEYFQDLEGYERGRQSGGVVLRMIKELNMILRRPSSTSSAGGNHTGDTGTQGQNCSKSVTSSAPQAPQRATSASSNCILNCLAPFQCWTGSIAGLAAMQRTSNECEFDYVIIGAGPAGLAAAGHLAKVGARVAVFDGRPRPENGCGSYPVVLNARGLAALESLGPEIMQKVLEVGTEVAELHIVPGGRTVARVPACGTVLMRDQAAQILLEAAERRSNIKFFWGYRLESMDIAKHSCTFTTPHGVQLTVSSISRLIAADGHKSCVRRACAQQVPGFLGEEQPWGFHLRFMTSKPGLQSTRANPETHYVLGDKGYVCRQPNGVWNISLRVLPGFDEDFLTANKATPDRIKQLKAYVAQHAGIAKDLLDDDSYRGFYEGHAFDGLVIKCSCLNPAGWIAVIGDAAHAVQPATGEGINSGLEDAAVLAAAARQNPSSPFTAFDSHHRANAHALHKLATNARASVVPASTRDRAVGVMVTLGLRVAKKLKIIEGKKEDFMMGELARSQGVKSYAELEELEQRQTRRLRSRAKGITGVCQLRRRLPRGT